MYDPHRPVRIVEHWWCPVCGAAAHRTDRLGRPRIYCSHACRQRAYRERLRACARTRANSDHPAPRASIRYGKSHALRTFADRLSTLNDAGHRELTVCGLLARPARLNRSTMHYKFLPDRSSACQTCSRIVTSPDLVTGTLTSWQPHHPPHLTKFQREQYDAVIARILAA
jgi:hypothetical protein